MKLVRTLSLGPLRLLVEPPPSWVGAGKAAAGRRAPLGHGSWVALRATSPALLGSRGPSRNWLRSLRSLRSNNRDESEDEARHGHETLRCWAPQMRCARRPATALRARPCFVEDEAAAQASSLRSAGAMRARSPRRVVNPSQSNVAVVAKPWVGARRRPSAAPRSAGCVVSARSALHELTRRDCLSEANTVSAASFATGPRDRAPQGTWPAGPRSSRSEAPTGARPRLCSFRPPVERRLRADAAPRCTAVHAPQMAQSAMATEMKQPPRSRRSLPPEGARQWLRAARRH